MFSHIFDERGNLHFALLELMVCDGLTQNTLKGAGN